MAAPCPADALPAAQACLQALQDLARALKAGEEVLPEVGPVPVVSWRDIGALEKAVTSAEHWEALVSVLVHPRTAALQPWQWVAMTAMVGKSREGGTVSRVRRHLFTWARDGLPEAVKEGDAHRVRALCETLTRLLDGAPRFQGRDVNAVLDVVARVGVECARLAPAALMGLLSFSHGSVHREALVPVAVAALGALLAPDAPSESGERVVTWVATFVGVVGPSLCRSLNWTASLVFPIPTEGRAVVKSLLSRLRLVSPEEAAGGPLRVDSFRELMSELYVELWVILEKGACAAQDAGSGDGGPSLVGHYLPSLHMHAAQWRRAFWAMQVPNYVQRLPRVLQAEAADVLFSTRVNPLPVGIRVNDDAGLWAPVFVAAAGRDLSPLFAAPLHPGLLAAAVAARASVCTEPHGDHGGRATKRVRT